jgi:hypothetical protein
VRRQNAPGFDRILGLLNILQEGEFAVKTAPPTGLEQLGEIFQPLLGKRAPTRDSAAAACRV